VTTPANVFYYGVHDRWSETRVESQWGEFFTPADQRDHGMLNHFCFILLELWVCGLGRASPPRPGSFPVKEPSSVTFNGKRKLKGLKGPAASYKRQKKAAFCSFLFTSQKQ